MPADPSTTNSTCRVIRAESTYSGKQGFDYFHGISAESVGARAICMHLLTIPSGGLAKTHLHENHETAIHVLSGHGDLIYIPAGVPHLPANSSDVEPCSAVLARTDPNEQESVVLRPDLDDRARN